MYDLSKNLKHAFHTLCELNQDFTVFFCEFQDLMQKKITICHLMLIL